jgi:hypothetical protein
MLYIYAVYLCCITQIFQDILKLCRKVKKPAGGGATCPLSTLTGKTSAKSPRKYRHTEHKETVYGKQLKNTQIKQ